MCPLSTPATIVDYHNPDIVSHSDYYAFGANKPGTQWTNLSSPYRYTFNGKEKDPEGVSTSGNTQDYGERFYNPSLGRFLSVDPLANQFAWWTPYQFAGDMPIKYIDLDGAEPKDPGKEGDLEDAPMTSPDKNGNYDDNMHTWQWVANTWKNMGLTLDNRTEGINQPDIISRGEWGANPANSNSSYTPVDPTTFYKYIAIHHAGNDNSPTINDEQNAHQKDRGFNDIGYHYAIDLKGNIYAGRPLWKQGAACEAADKQGVLSIVVLGDMQSDGFDDWSNDRLTPAATTSLIKLCTYLSIKYNITYIGGHTDVYCDHTECPGNQIKDILPAIQKATNTQAPPCLTTDTRPWYQRLFD
jgi:RHS repeat-associated protein